MLTSGRMAQIEWANHSLKDRRRYFRKEQGCGIRTKF